MKKIKTDPERFLDGLAISFPLHKNKMISRKRWKNLISENEYHFTADQNYLRKKLLKKKLIIKIHRGKYIPSDLTRFLSEKYFSLLEKVVESLPHETWSFL